MSEDVMPKIEKVKTPIEELEVLAELRDSVQFVILKRVARRYIEYLKAMSFTISADDPNLAIKHATYLHEARGIETLIKMVEGARAEKNRREEVEE